MCLNCFSSWLLHDFHWFNHECAGPKDDFHLLNTIFETFNLYYKVWCLSVCQHCNVLTLTRPLVLKLWDTHDLVEVIKLIEETFEPFFLFFFQKTTLCHSFRIIVIPSVLLSFLPDYCHSFRIFVILSRCLSFLLY